MTKTFEAEGLVLGNLWGGGKGAYPTIKVSAPGAMMIITTISRVEVDGKPFINREFETQPFGELDEMDEEFLLDNLAYI